MLTAGLADSPNRPMVDRHQIEALRQVDIPEGEPLGPVDDVQVPTERKTSRPAPIITSALGIDPAHR